MRTPDVCCQDLANAPRYESPLTRLGLATSGVLKRLAAMHRTAGQRRDLRDLDDRTLRDIGVSRADVEREIGRHFWDIDI